MDSVVEKFDTPILFLVFNRPEVTERVFEEIRKVQPTSLFIAADGPRENKEGEKEKCERVREIVSNINWNCTVETLFRENNLGCGKAVSGAITWFFEHVEMGIILEDDCLPSSSFFSYCKILLEKYKDSKDVGMITGTNGLSKWKVNHSYVFSHYAQIWGWATWRRAWDKYDFEMSAYNDDVSFLNTTFLGNNKQVKAFKKIFDSYFYDKNKGYTWDYQWIYTITKHNLYCIAPKLNLINNIGFGSDATHTTYELSAETKIFDLDFPLVHPKDLFWDYNYDWKLGVKFEWIKIKNLKYLIQKFKNFIHKIEKRRSK